MCVCVCVCVGHCVGFMVHLLLTHSTARLMLQATTAGIPRVFATDPCTHTRTHRQTARKIIAWILNRIVLAAIHINRLCFFLLSVTHSHRHSWTDAHTHTGTQCHKTSCFNAPKISNHHLRKWPNNPTPSISLCAPKSLKAPWCLVWETKSWRRWLCEYVLIQ